MARPRTPIEKAKMTGAAAHDPQRFRNRSQPEASGPIGDPPSFLNAKEKKAWRNFASEWSWLTNQDRPALVALVQMRTVAEDAKAEKTAAFYTAYRLMLSEFGGTPVSRSKVFQAKGEDEDDPFAQFGTVQ